TWGTGKWDSYFTCDPSVIRGEFINPENGNAYSHAMYYTATDRSDGTNNKIGLAFSNDGITWERLSRPVIAPQVNATSGYGAGQAATYNINAKAGIYVFYTDTSTNLGSRVWVRYTSNGIAFGPPVLLSNQGVPLSYNSDFAYDYNSGYFYAAISLLPRPVDRETYRFVIARMPANDLLNGHGVWEALATVDTGVTGYYLNHSPGLLRDYYGNLTPWLPAIEVYFSEGTNDPATWDLTWVIWSP
ncbi:MAG: hypothetical protein HZB22_02410, partial [Deltaproteobacteria bacterium]|nr:hypothetical protein [Deltaproteobacteria bacterium]